VVFLNPRRSDRPIADILEPDTVLETYQEEIEAVNSFFPNRVVTRQPSGLGVFECDNGSFGLTLNPGVPPARSR
jgi:hypothetical protein